MNKTHFLLGLIIILALALRMFDLGKIPNGFYSDEAAYGYNAYSILQTGKDEYGNFLPLAFKSFGDYKTPLYIYFLVPFVGLFGLNEVSIRLGSVVLGIGSVMLLYILVKKIFKNNSLALLSALFTSVSPFALQFNRMAHENNLVVFLVLAGLVFFIQMLSNSNYVFLSAAAFILSIYTYHDARVFVPLFALILAIIYRNQLFNFKRKLIIAVIFSIVLLVPFLNLLRSDAFWSRPRFTAISSDLGTSLRINEERGEDIKISYFSPTLFHNKPISYGLNFIDNYMKHFSFDFLFLSGDPVKIYSTVGNGPLYIVTAPFILLGLYFLFAKKLSHKWLIFSWLFIPPVASALTRFVPSASRILSIMPVVSILTSIGLFFSLPKKPKPVFRKIFSAVFVCLIALNITYYLHYYYINTPIKYAKEWHYGMREVLSEVEKLQSGYSTVWFSKNAWGYIYPLFFLKYPPARYQPQAKLSALNEFGFGWVAGFDKYIFADIPDKNHRSSGTLYIGNAGDFPDLKKPLYSVYYPDGQAAFYLTDTNSF